MQVHVNENLETLTLTPDQLEIGIYLIFQHNDCLSCFLLVENGLDLVLLQSISYMYGQQLAENKRNCSMHFYGINNNF